MHLLIENACKSTTENFTAEAPVFDSTVFENKGHPVRDTSSNDTSSTTTLRPKFLSNYQFAEK